MHESLGFYIGNFFVAYYGLLILTGITVSLILAYFQIKKYKLDFDNYVIALSISSLFAIIGAKILYLGLEFNNINFTMLSNFKYLNRIMSSGFVFYGALIGGLLGFYLVQKKFNVTIKPYIQATMFTIPLTHAFGRLGCHTVGCCHGREFNNAISIMYTNSIIAPNNVWLFPVQITESICNFMIAGILFIFAKKLKDYQALYLYIILYSITRFTLEFFRGDLIRGVFFNISTSQYISIAVFMMAIFALVKSKRNNKLEA